MLRGPRTPNVDRLARQGKTTRLAEIVRRRDLVDGTRGEVLDMAAPGRRKALAALAGMSPDQIATPEVLAAAAEALMDPAEDIAYAAVTVLAAADGPDATDLLVQGAADGLARGGHAAARRDALQIVSEGGEAAVVAFANHLIRRPDDFPLSVDDTAALRSTLEQATGRRVPSRRLVDSLVAELKNPTAGARARAEEILSWFAPHVVDTLVAALADPATRRGAVGALATARDASAIPALTRTLVDHDPEIRRRAVHALGEVMSPRAVESLLGATDDEDYRVRSEAVQALDRLGTVGVVVGIETIARRGAPQVEAALAGQELPRSEEKAPALKEPLSVEDSAPVPHEPPAAEEPAEEPAEETDVRVVAREPSPQERPLWPGLRRVLDSTRSSRDGWPEPQHESTQPDE